MGIFRKKKIDVKRDVEISEGVLLGCPRNAEERHGVLKCVPKGILVFLVVFGSLAGFVSAFNVECNYILPALILLFVALYFSGLYTFKKSRNKDFGYMLFFVFYVLGIYTFKEYVNSGFAAVVNMVRQRGELYFELSAGTEFAENIENRYLTVTIMLIFIGSFEIILLNIFISNYMSLKLTLIVTLPLFVIPLYFQVDAEPFFVLCMMGGYAGIYIFKNSGHFKDGRSRLAYEQEEKKGKIPEISYTQDTKVYRGILLAVLCCTLVIGLFSSLYTSSDLQKQYKENKYKTATREGVSGFIMLGLRSFFPNLYSKGGMSGGNLGRFSALRPDNEVDLVVRFAPFDTNPVYLKAYTGIMYERNNWFDGYRLMQTEMDSSDYFRIESMENEAEQLAKIYKKDKKNNARAVMDITNKGADVSYVYYPYFTRFEDYEKYTDNTDTMFVGSGLNQENSFTFYPNIGYNADVSELTSYIYRQLPEGNQEAIDAFLEEADIHVGDSDAIQKVTEHLKTEYSYSYNPGRVPEGEDFINYFLTDNKKGVCAHFASAATLIFRRLGISARYVEGYAFGYSQVLQGRVREDLKYEDYYSGYSLLGETAVMEVDVTDANAHAWVEVYLSGRGWMVVDPTPAVMEEEERGGDFWSSVRRFWEQSPEVNIEGDISGFNLGFLNSTKMKLLGGVVGGVLILGFLIWVVARHIYRWARWHTKNLQQNMLWYYRDLCRRKGKRDSEFAKLSVPKEQLEYLIERQEEKGNKAEDLDVERVVSVLEQICFSSCEPEKTDYEYVINSIKKL